MTLCNNCGREETVHMVVEAGLYKHVVDGELVTVARIVRICPTALFEEKPRMCRKCTFAERYHSEKTLCKVFEPED